MEILKLKSKLIDKAIIGYDPAFNPNNFFFKKDCFLKDYKTEDGKQAGNLINAYSSKYGVNQRMIIVTLQREQGLINYKNLADIKPYFKWLILKPDGKQRAVNTPNEEQTPKLDPGEIVKDKIRMDLIDWACGYGVPDDGINMAFKGLEQQIMGACKIYKGHYLNWKPGMQKELVPPDKEKWCIPETGITYSQLMYTPHQTVLQTNERYYDQFFPGYIS